MNPDHAAIAKKNRLTILLLLAVFLVPALGSWLLYANRANVHLGTTNKGEFIEPPRSLDPKQLGLPADYFAHRFTLVYVASAGCDPDCRQALHVMQGTQLAMGEQTSSVQRLYLSLGAAPLDLTQGDAGLTVRGALPKDAFKDFPAGDDGRYIYLADPNGYVVLRYALTQDPKYILMDLRHLLGAGEG